jgi:tetratricopeptide (TPR) repeat protein
MPPLTATATAASEAFWTGAWQQELSRLAAAPPPRPNFWQKQIRRCGFTPAPIYQNNLLAEWYSRSLTAWGVALQQQGHLSKARLRLEQALRLNTNNFSARISLACNTQLQTGHNAEFTGVDKDASQFGSPERLRRLLNKCGPFDDPVYCYQLGVVFQKGGMAWQAAEQFERSRFLAPDALTPELALAELYDRLHCADRSGPLINHLLEATRKLPADNPLNLEVTLLEAASWLAQTNSSKASSVLDSVLRQHADDVQVENSVITLYLRYGDFTDSFRVLNARLATSPDDLTNLIQQLKILILAGQTAATLPVLDHILALTNLPEIRLERALARLDAQANLAAAEADIHELEKIGNQPGLVGYGRAMLAEHQQETNHAAQYLRLCLSNTPPGTIFWQNARARLQAIESSSPASRVPSR